MKKQNLSCLTFTIKNHIQLMFKFLPPLLWFHSSLSNNLETIFFFCELCVSVQNQIQNWFELLWKMLSFNLFPKKPMHACGLCNNIWEPLYEYMYQLVVQTIATEINTSQFIQYCHWSELCEFANFFLHNWNSLSSEPVFT